MIMVDSRRRVDQKTSDEQLRRKREETEALLHPFLWLCIIYTLERVQHEKRDETGGGGAGGGGRGGMTYKHPTCVAPNEVAP